MHACLSPHMIKVNSLEEDDVIMTIPSCGDPTYYRILKALKNCRANEESIDVRNPNSTWVPGNSSCCVRSRPPACVSFQMQKLEALTDPTGKVHSFYGDNVLHGISVRSLNSCGACMLAHVQDAMNDRASWEESFPRAHLKVRRPLLSNVACSFCTLPPMTRLYRHKQMYPSCRS